MPTVGGKKYAYTPKGIKQLCLVVYTKIEVTSDTHRHPHTHTDLDIMMTKNCLIHAVP